MNKVRLPNNDEIDIVADIFAKGNAPFHCKDGEQWETEWILSHAFILGAKYMRDMIKIQCNE